MKPISFSIMILSFFIMAACSSSKVPSAEEQNKTAQMIQKVESRDFTIEVSSVIPMRGKQIFPNYGYDLKIKNDSAYAYLPYFGVAYSAPYGGGEGGVKFSEVMKGYTSVPNKKNNGWDIRFKVSAKDYTYDIYISAFNNGSATINVNSDQKDPISYNGNIKTESP